MMTRKRRGRSASAPSIEIVIDSPLWNAVPSVKSVLRRAIIVAALGDSANAEVAVLLTDDRSVRSLNRQWRGHDSPTNVLSFPVRAMIREDDAPTLLGDIVIAYETAAEEAAAEGKPFL